MSSTKLFIKTREALAREYGMCRKTFRKEMKALGYDFPRTLTPPWQKLIYEELGYPDGVERADYVKVDLPRRYRNAFE